MIDSYHSAGDACIERSRLGDELGANARDTLFTGGAGAGSDGGSALSLNAYGG